MELIPLKSLEKYNLWAKKYNENNKCPHSNFVKAYNGKPVFYSDEPCYAPLFRGNEEYWSCVLLDNNKNAFDWDYTLWLANESAFRNAFLTKTKEYIQEYGMVLDLENAYSSEIAAGAQLFRFQNEYNGALIMRKLREIGASYPEALAIGQIFQFDYSISEDTIFARERGYCGHRCIHNKSRIDLLLRDELLHRGHRYKTNKQKFLTRANADYALCSHHLVWNDRDHNPEHEIYSPFRTLKNEMIKLKVGFTNCNNKQDSDLPMVLEVFREYYQPATDLEIENVKSSRGYKDD